MELPAFSVTWDYRCPFARNAHEHLIEALRAGAKWEVTFVPFNLGQVHVPEGGTQVWDDPTKEPDLLATAAAVVVRDSYPDRFLDLHQALFTARHDEGRDLRERDVVRDVLEQSGVPTDDVLAAVDEGAPAKLLRAEHDQSVADYGVWGVPTFIAGGRAVFVRIMTRPAGDAELARSTIEKVVRLVVDEPDLNEFKQTTVHR
jgi:DSBA-like thioredoxin domain